MQYLAETNIIPILTPESHYALKEYELEAYNLYKNFSVVMDVKNFDPFFKIDVPNFIRIVELY